MTKYTSSFRISIDLNEAFLITIDIKYPLFFALVVLCTIGLKHIDDIIWSQEIACDSKIGQRNELKIENSGLVFSQKLFFVIQLTFLLLNFLLFHHFIILFSVFYSLLSGLCLHSFILISRFFFFWISSSRFFNSISQSFSVRKILSLILIILLSLSILCVRSIIQFIVL